MTDVYTLHHGASPLSHPKGIYVSEAAAQRAAEAMKRFGESYKKSEGTQ